jgi:hypothetical protein
MVASHIPFKWYEVLTAVVMAAVLSYLAEPAALRDPPNPPMAGVPVRLG